MSHEIETTDAAGYFRRAAWHGLGMVIPDEFGPVEGLRRIKADWNVDQEPLYREHINNDGERTFVAVESHVANVRCDTNATLGVVGSGYQPLQNIDVAKFAESLAEGSDTVTVESVGTIQSGRRFWMLLRGESFSVRNEDEIVPYILLSNSHDGTSAYRGQPTTVRVVCSNTLHMVIPRFEDESGELKSLDGTGFAFRHTSGILERVEEAKRALRLYGRALEGTRTAMQTLAARDVTSDAVQQFFLEAYTAEFGEIPAHPADAKEQRRRAKATSAWHSFSRRFDDERPVAGATMWNAFNAFSGTVQHDLKARGRDDSGRVENRVKSNLFGLNADRTSRAFKTAMKLTA